MRLVRSLLLVKKGRWSKDLGATVPYKIVMIAHSSHVFFVDKIFPSPASMVNGKAKMAKKDVNSGLIHKQFMNFIK